MVPDSDAGAGEGAGRSEMVPGNKSAAWASDLVPDLDAGAG